MCFLVFQFFGQNQRETQNCNQRYTEQYMTTPQHMKVLLVTRRGTTDATLVCDGPWYDFGMILA